MKYKFLICLLMCVISSQAQVLDSLGCSGIVGDLKFSLLELPDFQKENGNCWTLMDGKDVTSSKLGAYGYSTVPDPRGLFLRVNDNRPDGSRTDINRPFGTSTGVFQDDEIRNHRHNIPRLTEYIPNRTGNYHNNQWKNDGGIGAEFTAVDGGRYGGKETRPKNMNFHLYVRIN
jgi:hypothetical protein